MSKVSRIRGHAWLAALVGAGALAAQWPAEAQTKTPAPMPATAAAPAGLPAERQVGAASGVSGGIAEGESTRFIATFERYPLVVQLFERSGAKNDYTADAKVRITDTKGLAVLDERSNGPFMLVRLPAGEYRVSASLKGKTLPEQRIRVTDGGHVKATFIFPEGTG